MKETWLFVDRATIAIRNETHTAIHIYLWLFIKWQTYADKLVNDGSSFRGQLVCRKWTTFVCAVQIVEWKIEKYSERFTSPLRINKWADPKHENNYTSCIKPSTSFRMNSSFRKIYHETELAGLHNRSSVNFDAVDENGVFHHRISSEEVWQKHPLFFSTNMHPRSFRTNFHIMNSAFWRSKSASFYWYLF